MAWKSWQTRSQLLLRDRRLRQHTVHLSGRFSLLRIQKDMHPSVELLPMQRDPPIPVPLVRCWPSSERRIRRHPQRGFGISCKGEGYILYAYGIHALTHSVFTLLSWNGPRDITSLPGVGHWHCIEAAEEVGSIVLEFAGQVLGFKGK